MVASAGAFLIQTRAQRGVSPTRTAVIFTMEPVFAGLFGFLLAGERLSGRGWLGAGLVLAGMLIAELGGRLPAGPGPPGPTEATMIQVRVCGTAGRSATPTSPTWRRSAASRGLWSGSTRPGDPDELAALGREFDIHEVALEDLEVGERQRPKIEQYQDQVLLVFYAALPESPAADPAVRGRPGRRRNYLITFHGGPLVDPDPFARRVKARPDLACEDAGYLLYVALDGSRTPSSRPWTPSANGSSRSRRRSWPATPTSMAGSWPSARS